jgi:NAD(P)H dehydrogenase (quinone)
MQIGVTGATGQLGQQVISKLKHRMSSGHIIALVRSAAKAKALGIEIREADYTKPHALVNALKGIDQLLLISSNEIGQRVTHHKNVIEAAKKAGVKWIVYTSLLHADTSTLTLAPEHLETEQALKASGIPFTILRNGWYTENYTSNIKGALAGGALIGSSGSGKISSAARADFADAAVAVLTGKGHEGKTYELAGDTAYTLDELAKEVSRQTGKLVPYKDLPEEEYVKVLTGFGLQEGIAKAIAGWDVSISEGELFDDSKQLSALIGHPTTSMPTVVAEAIAKG